ncbi:MAG: hypothetical protein PUG67_00060 [Peptoniphilaceae bacterium]|nr:hypothetical protein [Peptoniphilaceae bacterium]MDY6018100.1 hypothetical protein [Anaerococcus sp.]
MKKRDFNIKSLILIYLINVAISVALYEILGEDSKALTIVTGIIGAFFEFASCRGLIVNRKGSLGDYLEQIKAININFVFVNLLFVLLGFLISLISAGSLLATGLSFSRGKAGMGSLLTASFGLIGLTIILTIGLNLISAYANFVVADPRNKDLSIMDAFKEVFKAGLALMGKTFVSILKYMVLPFLVYCLVIFITAILMSKSGSSGISITFTVILLMIPFALIYIYLLIKYKGEISDHYLNLYGDYEEEFASKDYYDKENNFKLTREVEVDKDLEQSIEDEKDYEDYNDDEVRSEKDKF